MRDLDLPCKDIRTREVGMKQIQESVSPDDVELIRRDYVANGGWETFLAYEDPQKDILIGECIVIVTVPRSAWAELCGLKRQYCGDVGSEYFSQRKPLIINRHHYDRTVEVEKSKPRSLSP